VAIEAGFLRAQAVVLLAAAGHDDQHAKRGAARSGVRISPSPWQGEIPATAGPWATPAPADTVKVAKRARPAIPVPALPRGLAWNAGM
jgi:hypothetical protein